jgi:uncharacterized protein (DUF433 family)
MGNEFKLHIESHPDIMFGKPVVKGTRIPVDIILEKLAYGNSIESIMSDYPQLTRDDIYACLYYAS